MLLYVHFSGDDDKMGRRKRMHRRRNKRKKLIIIFLCAVLCIMAVGYSAFSTNINITTKGNIKDKSRTIQSWSRTSNEDFHTDFYKENIVSVTFLDNAIVPSNAIEKWDVSETKDQRVIAYVTESVTETGKYDLYIGAKNGVIANRDSSYLFKGFKGLKSITFNDNLDTSQTTNMIYMFAYCTNIIDLDLKSFNTNNVYEMGGMFEGCHNLKELDVSSFNTSKVKTMWYMFAECHELAEINLSNFNTSNLISMSAMFQGCHKIKELNLCSFNTTKVENYPEIFSYTTSLEQVYVGNNWTLENTSENKMFISSNISSVITGKCG